MFARLRLIPLILLPASVLLAAQPVFVPAGTEIHFKLRRNVSTATAKAGDHIPAELTTSLTSNGRVVASAGSPVTLRISEATASGRMGGVAKLAFSIGSVTLTNGRKVEVRTSGYSREGKAHAKHNASYIVGGAAIGALAGQALGGNGNATRNGAAIGAGVGVGAAAATGKFDFELPAGERFELSLRAPIRTTM